MDFYIPIALFGGVEMTERLSSATKIWLSLMALTAISVAIGEGGLLSRFSAVAIIVISAFKARMVILNYMEANHAPARWRVLYEGWNAVVAGIIIIMYVLSDILVI